MQDKHKTANKTEHNATGNITNIQKQDVIKIMHNISRNFN
jgi:hypothetical protein